MQVIGTHWKFYVWIIFTNPAIFFQIERPIISKYWRVLGGIDRSSISFKLDKNVFALQTAVNTLDIERLTTWDYDLQN